MRQLEPHLWQSTLHESGILRTHAYFLKRREGKVLVDSIGDERDLETIAELGGVLYQILSHRDESGPLLERVRSRFGSKLCCSAREARSSAQLRRSTSSSRKATPRSKTSSSSTLPAIPTAASVWV